MIALHCLKAKSNNRTCAQFECDLTWFCFPFVRSHAQCSCVKKQFDSKISTKNV